MTTLKATAETASPATSAALKVTRLLGELETYVCGQSDIIIDGLWGPETEAAVRSYQQQHNLNATGQLDSDTLASLHLGGTNQTLGSTPPAAAAPPVASAPPTGNTPPPSQVYGAGNTAPTNTNIPPGNAAQPNASTTR